MAAIVAIHGMWGHGRQWENWRSILEARGHRVMAPTLRHHDVDPHAPPPEGLGDTSLQDYADDIAQAIADLDEPPVLIGHSMGGLIAQILAARGVARAAVFLAPAPPAGWPAVVELGLPSVTRTFLRAILTSAIFVHRPHRPNLGTAIYSCLNRMPREQAEAEHARMVHESGRALFEIAFWFFDRSRHGARVDPDAVTCPTLTVGAGRDRITPVASVRATARRYVRDGGEYREYADYAHWVIAEPGWERIAQETADWIDAHA